MENQNYRIRKLTPKECWRLMGVKDEDFEKVAKNQSNSSLYHLAGDSIVTTCLMAIFGQMTDIDYKEKVKKMLKNLKVE
jgi:DNA (cytosine-5)-methyltransferase 1